jgi:hypothetical protein
VLDLEQLKFSAVPARLALVLAQGWQSRPIVFSRALASLSGHSCFQTAMAKNSRFSNSWSESALTKCRSGLGSLAEKFGIQKKLIILNGRPGYDLNVGRRRVWYFTAGTNRAEPFATKARSKVMRCIAH